MKTLRAPLVGAAVSLLLTSLPVAAGELPFSAPTTVRATESALLLHQTARALYDLPTSAAIRPSSDQRISNLWLFPTADADTVFARYNATDSTTEHLTVLTVRGNRILESRDLTSAQAESASNEPTKLHWSAAIGTGHAASTNAASTTAAGSSHGVPASPHWTARIGTGTAASTNSIPDSEQNSSSGTQHAVAAAHWTSRIGTGHASDTSSPVTPTS